MIIVKEIYDAFVSAGVDKELAEKASNIMIERQTEMEKDLHLLKWMMGLILGVCITLLIKAFS